MNGGSGGDVLCFSLTTILTVTIVLCKYQSKQVEERLPTSSGIHRTSISSSFRLTRGGMAGGMGCLEME